MYQDNVNPLYTAGAKTGFTPYDNPAGSPLLHQGGSTDIYIPLPGDDSTIDAPPYDDGSNTPYIPVNGGVTTPASGTIIPAPGVETPTTQPVNVPPLSDTPNTKSTIAAFLTNNPLLVAGGALALILLLSSLNKKK